MGSANSLKIGYWLVEGYVWYRREKQVEDKILVTISDMVSLDSIILYRLLYIISFKFYSNTVILRKENVFPFSKSWRFSKEIIL